MSGRKNSLGRYQFFTNADMQQELVSPVTHIALLDNIGIQLNFTGTPDGEFAVQVSADYAQDYLGNVINAGNWIDLDLSPAPVAAGAANQIYLELSQLSSAWIRTTFTPSTLPSASITTVADTGALNVYELTFPAKASLVDGEYLVLEAAEGGPWAVAVDLTGTSPEPTGAVWDAIPANRKVQVDLSSGGLTTAAQVAAAFEAAFQTIGGDNPMGGFMQLNDTAADGTMLVTAQVSGDMEVPESLTENDSGPGNITNTETVPSAPSSLQSSYFTLVAPLGSGETYQVTFYMNVSGGGVEPEVEGTDEYVALSFPIGSSDTDIATVLSGAITGLILQTPPKLANLGGTPPEVTFDAVAYGALTLTDGDISTGFTLSATNAGEGVLNGYITGKML